MAFLILVCWKKCIVLLLLLLFSFSYANLDNNKEESSSSSTTLSHKDSYPSNDEYDYKLLDPNTIYGSPYGGFSRGSRSRLASLPLRLPDIIIVEEDPKKQGQTTTITTDNSIVGGIANDLFPEYNSYMEINDDMGRPYICRVYHEDEVEPSSLSDSMFDPVVLKKPQETTTTTTTTETSTSTSTTADNSVDKQQVSDDDTKNHDPSNIPMVKEAEQTPQPPATNHAEHPSSEPGEGNAAVKEADAAVGNNNNPNDEDGADSPPEAAVTDDETTTMSEDGEVTATQPETAETATATAPDIGHAHPKDDKEISILAAQATENIMQASNAAKNSERLLKMGPTVGPAPNSRSLKNVYADDAAIVIETESRLSKLEGLCVQMHKGWWSYEWCYGKQVTQFHIHIDKKDSSTFQVQDISSLGSYLDRKIGKGDTNFYSKGYKEVSRVQDVYDNGDYCEDIKGPRQTIVNLQCCASKYLLPMASTAILRHGQPIHSNLLSVPQFIEDPDKVCNYFLTACTSLLCDDIEEDGDSSVTSSSPTKTQPSTTPSASSSIKPFSKGPSTTPSASSSNKPFSSRRKPLSATSKSPTYLSKKKKENESIREILDRTLGNNCIHSSSGGWWSYEACHGRHVRQFHESLVINTETGIALKDTESIFMLGYYDAATSESYPNEDEYKHVVNATSFLSSAGGGSLGGSSGGTSGIAEKGSLQRGGNGAYYEQEYINGDVCDHTDVTDAAIKAGNVGVGGSISRGSTVRYSCGKRYDVHVKEDSTCHYIVEVTVPDLCDHPLFRSPVSKNLIVKCLPIPPAS